MDDLPEQTTLPIHGGALPEDAEHEDRISEKLELATHRELATWLRAAETRAGMLELRLRQVSNYCQNQAAQAPSMVRECELLKMELAAVQQNVEKVREQLARHSEGEDGLKPAA
jgi:hypothetical protein